MRRALALARRGWGRVAPNPMVGAVVVAGEGEVVGEGWHREYGAPHAEMAALEAAGESARGATLFVNLEPCAHAGKTPPCTRALVEAGVSRVVVGCRDPHPEAGGGMEELRRAGVEVETGVEGMAAARLNAPFLWRHARGRPFTALKLALSLDARIAAHRGERTRVTGREAWSWAHRLRAQVDAVVVGRRTVEVDDPRLTARGEAAPRVPPTRVVLDSRLSLPLDARLARREGEGPVWVVCGRDPPTRPRRELEAAGVRVIPVATGPGGRVDPGAALEALSGRGRDTILLEGGGRVAASFLQEEVVQRMHLLYAPVVFGPEGVEGFPGVRLGPGGWTPARRAELGPDTLVTLEARPLTALLGELAGGPP